MHDASKMIICHNAVQSVYLICADMTTTEPQGTGRKRGHSDPKGADSEPGKCSYDSH